MQVEIQNDGPVTIQIDSPEQKPKNKVCAFNHRQSVATTASYPISQNIK